MTPSLGLRARRAWQREHIIEYNRCFRRSSPAQTSAPRTPEGALGGAAPWLCRERFARTPQSSPRQGARVAESAGARVGVAKPRVARGGRGRF